MKISELISELEVYWGAEGDMDVLITNECCCYGDHEDDPTLRLSSWQNQPYLLLK